MLKAADDAPDCSRTSPGSCLMTRPLEHSGPGPQTVSARRHACTSHLLRCPVQTEAPIALSIRSDLRREGKDCNGSQGKGRLSTQQNLKQPRQRMRAISCGVHPWLTTAVADERNCRNLVGSAGDCPGSLFAPPNYRGTVRVYIALSEDGVWDGNSPPISFADCPSASQGPLANMRTRHLWRNLTLGLRALGGCGLLRQLVCTFP